MKLKEQWGTKIWEPRSNYELIIRKLYEADGGQIEELKEQVLMLGAMVAALMDQVTISDKQKLEIVGLSGWEVM